MTRTRKHRASGPHSLAWLALGAALALAWLATLGAVVAVAYAA